MRKVLIETATGLVVNIIVLPDEPDPENPWTPPADHSVIDDDGTADIGGTWDGAQFLPPPPIDWDAIHELEAARLLSRAADLTFLDGHWITLRALDGAGISTGVSAIDTAVAADDRAAFDEFFKDQVKSRLPNQG